jgi:murein DD-endopeptidase MepM/ murein hydrolase activator NlpD
MNYVRYSIFLIIIISILTTHHFVFAQANLAITTSSNTKSSIEATIAEKNRQIQELEQQINQYQNHVQEISGQAKSLNQEVSRLRGSEKLLETSLKTTNTKIQKTNYTIEKNINEIKNLSLGIADNRNAIGATIRSIAQNDARTPIEMFLEKKTLSHFLQDYHDIQQFQNKLRGVVTVMRDKSLDLVFSQKNLTEQKEDLKQLSSELADKEEIISSERKEKDTILKETKNKEATYKKIVSDLQKKRDQIDAEVRDYESKLKFVLSTKNLPQTGSETFGWPIDNVVITQKFGRTVDSRRLYTSGSHSGVDFRAAVGTPIYAVGSGIVEGTGDTDKTCPKASFGKWIFIRHNNGLSTAYGHLSLIKVTTGQTVSKGDLIGYSGNTGRSTGPHLHLTVYASTGANGEEGARVTERPSSACSGKTYTMPLAPINAYLDPLVYLPKTGFSTKY